MVITVERCIGGSKSSGYHLKETHSHFYFFLNHFYFCLETFHRLIIWYGDGDVSRKNVYTIVWYLKGQCSFFTGSYIFLICFSFIFLRHSFCRSAYISFGVLHCYLYFTGKVLAYWPFSASCCFFFTAKNWRRTFCHGWSLYAYTSALIICGQPNCILVALIICRRFACAHLFIYLEIYIIRLLLQFIGVCSYMVNSLMKLSL